MAHMANAPGRSIRARSARPRVLRRDPSNLTTFCSVGIITFMFLELLFLCVGCHWELCGDEAEYWAWSRHLDWSYFAKGPLIAWLIRLSTTLTGACSIRWTGSLMPSVRLPAVLLGGLTAWGLFRLGSLTCRDRRVGAFALFLLPAVPLFAAGGVLMTIDTPFLCCWTWAAVWTYRGIVQGEIRSWTAAGLLAALGVLAKYTMLIFPASVALFLLLSPPRRRQLIQPGFWIMAFGCGLGMLPIAIWNARHQWVGAGHLASRVGLTHSTWGNGGTVLRFLAGEAAALGGIWFLVGIQAVSRAAFRVARPTPGAEAERSGLLFLLCLGGTAWSACLTASLLGVTQPNWAAPGYVAGLVLIGWRIRTAISSGSKSPQVQRGIYAGAWCLSVLLLAALHHTEWFYPLVARHLPAATLEQPTPIRRFDPTCRLRGYRALAREVDRWVKTIRTEGGKPFVLTPAYGLASSLSFSMMDQPEVYCLGGPTGLTARVGTQHDIWRPNPRMDCASFRGRPAVIVEPVNSSQAQAWAKAGLFGRAEREHTIVVRECGVAVAAWKLTIGRDYRGLPTHDRTADFNALQDGWGKVGKVGAARP